MLSSGRVGSERIRAVVDLARGVTEGGVEAGEKKLVARARRCRRRSRETAEQQGSGPGESRRHRSCREPKTTFDGRGAGATTGTQRKS